MLKLFLIAESYEPVLDADDNEVGVTIMGLKGFVGTPQEVQRLKRFYGLRPLQISFLTKADYPLAELKRTKGRCHELMETRVFDNLGSSDFEQGVD